MSGTGITTDLNRPISDTLLPVLQMLQHDSVVCPVQLQWNGPIVPQLESSTEIMAYASSYWHTRNLGAIPLPGAPRLQSHQRPSASSCRLSSCGRSYQAA
jgi:hypothetical protein